MNQETIFWVKKLTILKKFSDYSQTKYGVAVSNATDAIQIALMAIGIKFGDEVITVSHTAVASVSGIVSANATPVFVDICESDMNVDVEKVEKLITSKTKAILVVHLYGNPANMSRIIEICKKKKIFIIEDCASTWCDDKKKVGSFGDVSVFSFYPTKNLSTLWRCRYDFDKQQKIFELSKKLRQYGWNKHRESDFHGLNSRMDEIHAAILNLQVNFLDYYNKRRIIAEYYDKNLDGNQITLPKKENFLFQVYHHYVIRTKFRDNLKKELELNGINVGIHYPLPIHQMKSYKKYVKHPLPITEKIKKQILSLPIHPYLNKKEQNKVISVINRFFKSYEATK